MEIVNSYDIMQNENLLENGKMSADLLSEKMFFF